MNNLAQSGIYRITNTVNGKMYIGGSNNIYIRVRAHKRELDNGSHINKYLQRAWNKYWEQSFKFEVLEYCEVDKLIEREQYWLDKTQCYNEKFGYNLFKFARSGLGYRQSEEHKKKISIANTGKIVSEETKKRISEKNKGYKHTEEAKRLISLASKGNKYSLGRKLSEERKEQISIFFKGKTNATRNKSRWPCQDGYKCKCDICCKTRRVMKNEDKIKRKLARRQRWNDSIKPSEIFSLLSFGA